MDSSIKYLLTYCQDKPELYNQVATKLWVEFGIRSAEMNLLCTYMISEWRNKNEYRGNNEGSDKKVGGYKKTKKYNTKDHGRTDGSKQGTHIQF